MKNVFKTALRPPVLAAGALLAGSLLPALSVQAADPYDRNLAARVGAQQREIDALTVKF